MATKPDDGWPANQQQQESSKYEKAFYRVLGACVCVLAVALTTTVVVALVRRGLSPFVNGGAA